jgi:anti-sigma B factor antagonist
MSESQLLIQTVKDAHHVSFMDSRILDETTIKDIYNEISKLIDSNPKIKLILDFEKVDYLSSAVLGKLVALNKEVKNIKGRMVLANIKKPILEVFKITKLEKVLDIQKDALAAMKSLGS